MTKTKQANDMIDNRGVVYAKNETKLLWPIKLGMVYEKTRQDSDITDPTSGVYTKKKINLSWPIGPGAICEEN